MLDTLEYLVHETDVWFEITTLLIPGHNDSDAELDEMTRWVVEHLGPDVPMHFTAFHPDFKMLDVGADAAGDAHPRAARSRSRNGVRYAYTGNVHDADGGSTYCPAAARASIERDWYVHRRLPPHRRRPLQALRRRRARPLRRAAGRLGRPAPARPARRLRGGPG